MTSLRPLHFTTDPTLDRVKFVVMDVDGTLVVGGDETIDNVVEQLRRLKQHGIHFSLATGRTLYGVRQVVDQLLGVGATMPLMIAYNGAVIARPDATALLNRRTIGGAEYHDLIQQARADSMHAWVYVCRHRLDVMPVEEVYGEINPVHCPEKDFNRMPLRWIEDLRSLTTDVVAVLLASAEKETDVAATARRLADRYAGKLRVTWSGGRYVEVAHPAATKLNALSTLVQLSGYSLEDVMAIGDNFNDLEMIGAVGYGVAVANAPTEVKAVARLVCSRAAAEGVVEVLRQLLANLRYRRIQGRAARSRRVDEG